MSDESTESPQVPGEESGELAPVPQLTSKPKASLRVVSPAPESQGSQRVPRAATAVNAADLEVARAKEEAEHARKELAKTNTKLREYQTEVSTLRTEKTAAENDNADLRACVTNLSATTTTLRQKAKNTLYAAVVGASVATAIGAGVGYGVAYFIGENRIRTQVTEKITNEQRNIYVELMNQKAEEKDVIIRGNEARIADLLKDKESKDKVIVGVSKQAGEELGTLKADKQTLEQRIKELTSTSSTHTDADYNTLNQQYQTVTDNYKTAQVQIKQDEEKLDAAAKANKDLEGKLNATNTENGELSAENERLYAEVEELYAQQAQPEAHADKEDKLPEYKPVAKTTTSYAWKRTLKENKK